LYLAFLTQNTKTNDMNTKHKELYQTPQTDALEVKTEGVICQSMDPLDPFNPGGDPLSAPQDKISLF
jgi:hypothetical protein